MKKLITLCGVVVMAACSVSLPQKEAPGATWRLLPKPVAASVNQLTPKKPLSIVIAKPWLASGFDSKHVIVTNALGEMSVLAGVSWPDNYGEWLRNYFLEGLQSSGQFDSVFANQKLRVEHWVVQIYLWDLSVYYPAVLSQGTPTVKAKIAVSIADGRGNKLIEQQTIVAERSISENRVGPIMAGFDAVIDECFNKVFHLLVRL